MPRAQTYGALATVDRAEILERIAAGEYVPAIAAEFGISKQALAQSLAKWDKDAYLAARETAAEIRLDEATMAIERATDQIDLARARERFRAVAWRAEREHPHRWGSRPQTAVQVSGNDMTIQIVSYAHNNTLDNQLDAASIIDAEAEQDSDSV